MNSRRRLTWVAAASIGAAVMFWHPVAFAKPGIVTITGGQSLIGDVNETGQVVTVVEDSGRKTEINKSSIESTVYFENRQQEFAARMRTLGPKDVKGRIAVARWALKQKDDALAAQALDAALKID